MDMLKRLLALLGGIVAARAAWQLLAPELRYKGPSPFLAGAPARAIALITGASSGIGETFARRLAREGYDLVLVARRKERLEALSEDLKRRYAISAQPFTADLTYADDLRRVSDIVAGLSNEGQLDLLINNAGFGTVGHFADLPLAEQMAMNQVHITASVQLTRAALPGFLRRRRGAVINVASISGWTPMVGNVVYGASKRYLINFSQALQAELDGTGVFVQALCPGLTYTEFHDAPAYRAVGFRRDSIPAFMWQTSEQVVEASLNQLGSDDPICIPGIHNRAVVLISDFIPRALFREVRRRAGL
ncbi:MAG: SDR family oxidoreductase [Anaerolineae bacterium]|nr:SDR family oxidoreductase [Thermoflexales bacterium]MDW8395002.1 SDR family oxidoreductase [Anaerolineae bacterium]